MTEPTPTPRLNAATVLGMMHEERLAAANRPSREDRPSFSVKRSTASGSLGVMGFDAVIPVCEEYPTAELAFQALLDFTDRAVEHWPLPNGGTPKGEK